MTKSSICKTFGMENLVECYKLGARYIGKSGGMFVGRPNKQYPNAYPIQKIISFKYKMGY